MAEFELVLRMPGLPSHRFRVPAGGLRIGRSAECEIRLASPLVSRNHARVWPDQQGLAVEDLNSINGLVINGHPVKRGKLREGDKLYVGDSLFLVVKKSESTLGHTVIAPESAASLSEEIVRAAGNERLAVLYQASMLLGSVFDLDELLGKILSLIFASLPVRRGFILTQPPYAAAPEIHASLSREQSNQGPPLSHTLIQHVFDTKEAMLTTDAQTDSRFDSTESIIGYDIHSAMCVPLPGRKAIIGAIYVDTGTSSKPFVREDLELLTAIAGVVGVAVENARLHQEAVEQERLAAIGQATAGLGHCVKNIMTGIRGGGEFVNMAIEKKDLKYLEKGWPIMSRAIDRIDMLVMNMLSFSKERQPERQPADMNELVRDVFDVVRARAERHKIALEFEPPGPTVISMDARQMYRVVLNLVVNAVDACETKGGRVKVDCSVNGKGCALRVSDTGPGIKPELVPKLSQAFLSTKGSNGTGLGLACSFKIVREHEGYIEVDSTPGNGASFTVFLPHDPRATLPPE